MHISRLKASVSMTNAQNPRTNGLTVKKTQFYVSDRGERNTFEESVKEGK